MPSSSQPLPTQALHTLIAKLVPHAAPPLPGLPGRLDEYELEEREERMKELVEYCTDMLTARLHDPGPSSLRTLPDETKKRLLASSSTQGTDRAVRFSNLWRRLESSNILTAPSSHLHFLLALSSLDPSTHPAPPRFINPITNTPSSSGGEPKLRPVPPLREPNYTAGRPGSRASVGNVGAGSSSTGSTRRDGRSNGKGKEQEDDEERLGPTAAMKGKGRSKAGILNSWMARNGTPAIPDSLLLRDALYLLQGINGRFVTFHEPKIEHNPYLQPPEGEEPLDTLQLVFAEDDEAGSIPIPTRNLMANVAEIGWLCRNVEGFVKESQDGKRTRTPSGGGGSIGGGSDRETGLVEQSLCHFVQTQLTSYYHLVSILETQMTSSCCSATSHPSDPSSSLSPSASSSSTPMPEGSGLTLMRLGVWTRDARLKMRLMSLMVDDCRRSRGGALVSLIHAYTENGDPFARGFTDEVLEEVSKPFFDSLQRWIFHGELHDPYSEFFVRLNPDLAENHYFTRRSFLGAEDAGFEDGIESGQGGVGGGGGLGVESHLLWEKKYLFNEEMLPSFVNEEFGRKIYSTGKSLNFIRYSCHDSDWIATRVKLENAGKVLKYSDIAGLERSIDTAYEIASQRLLEVFFDKFMLMDHLRGLKQYLLLGHGDFVDALMGSLAPDLSKPANQLYRHTLTATLETAVRSSNAQHDPPDVRRRLDARMLPYSHGEIGWDCFLLEYKVDAPIDTVLDPGAMEGYHKMFVHLWKLKRVESALSGSWMRLTAGQSRGKKSKDTGEEWHHCRIVHAEMVHFIRQLQAFYQLEVIECSWQAFEELVNKNTNGLDGLMEAHKEYLGRLVSRILLVNPRSRSEDSLLRQVQQTFQIILDFRTATETLYRYTLEDEVRLDSERDRERGVFTQSPVLASQPKQRNTVELSRIRGQIRDLSGRFQDLVNTIAGTAAGHPDPEIKLLAIRCSYNSFYNLRPAKRTREHHKERSGKSSAA